MDGPSYPVVLAGRGLVEPRAAVDVDGLAGDEAAVVADQKQAGGGDFVDMPLTAQGNPGGAGHMAAIPLGIVSSSIDAAGGDDVGADIVRGELDGERTREPDQTHFRRRHMNPSATTGEGALAGEEQDAPVAVINHRIDNRPRTVHRPVEDDAPDLLPVPGRHLGEGLVR